MLHSEIPMKSTPYWERDRPATDKQDRLALFCKEWHLPAPQYKYIRNRYSGASSGIHSSVIVNDIEYSSTLATTEVHPGWLSRNDAREAVAGEVLLVLGLESEGDELPLILEES